MTPSLYASGALGSTLQESMTILLDLDHFGDRRVPDDVAAAVAHVTGFRLPGEKLPAINFDNFDTTARDYFNKIETHHGEEMAAVYVAFVTGYFHEMRHAHDLLSTKYGLDLLSSTFNLYRNTPELLMGLERWCTEDQRRFVPLPIGKVRDDYPETVRGILVRHQKLDERLRGFMSDVGDPVGAYTVMHLLEASATVTQLGIAQEIFGYEGIGLLRDLIAGSSQGAYYLNVFEDVLERVGARESNQSAVGPPILLMLWCALQITTFPGRPDSEGPSPSVMFEELCEQFIRKTARDEPLSIGLFDDAFRGWGLMTPAEVVERTKSEYRERAKQVRKQYEEAGLGTDLFSDGFTQFVDTHAYFTKIISENARAFFDPSIYVWMYVKGLLPAVHVKLHYRGEVNDFMSFGATTIAAEQWGTLAAMSTAFNIVMRGRNTSSLTFLEDIVFKLIVEKWNLRFRDNSGLFG